MGFGTYEGTGSVHACRPRVGAVEPGGLGEAEESMARHVAEVVAHRCVGLNK